MTPTHAKFVSVTTLVLAVGNIVMLPPAEICKELYITKNNVNTGFYKTFSQEQITGYFKQWK